MIALVALLAGASAGTSATPARTRVEPRVLRRTFAGAGAGARKIAGVVYVPPEPPDAHRPPPWTPVLLWPESGLRAPDYASWGRRLADDGFIGVVLTSARPEDAPGIYVALRAESARPASVLFGRVSPNGFACVGHGDGGRAALAAAGAPSVRGCVALDPAEPAGPGPPALARRARTYFPLLVVGIEGEAACIPAARGIDAAYAAAESPKYRVTLTGGGHCAFADRAAPCRKGCPPGKLPPREQRELAQQVVLRFLAAHAADDASIAPMKFLASLNHPALRSHATLR